MCCWDKLYTIRGKLVLCLEIMYSWQLLLVSFKFRNHISNLHPIAKRFCIDCAAISYSTNKFKQENYVHLMFYFSFPKTQIVSI